MHGKLLSPDLNQFSWLSQEEVGKILVAVKPCTCLLDPCPDWLVKICHDGVWIFLENVIILSLSSGIFPVGLKEAVVHLLLKKLLLDTMILNNYYSVSNLPLLGKIDNRIVKEHIQTFLDNAVIMNPF